MIIRSHFLYAHQWSGGRCESFDKKHNLTSRIVTPNISVHKEKRRKKKKKRWVLKSNKRKKKRKKKRNSRTVFCCPRRGMLLSYPFRDPKKYWESRRYLKNRSVKGQSKRRNNIVQSRLKTSYVFHSRWTFKPYFQSCKRSCCHMWSC